MVAARPGRIPLTARRRLIAAMVLAAILAAAGVALWRLVPGPRLLSWADAAVGGGRDVVLAADAVPFGAAGQTLDVWRPAAGRGRRPVVVFFYGGGWVHGDRRSYAFAARAFARAGFVVVVPDYRKVPAARFPAFVEDGAAAVRWTHDHVAALGGDPGRIALAGHSAGAYIAAMLALDRRWLSQAGVDPAVVRAAVPMCGPYDFYPYTGRAVAAFAGKSDPRATQPVAFARAGAPPMLLLVAGRDTQVRARNAINLAARLRGVGGRVAVRTYAGLSHENVVMALSRPFAHYAPVLEDSTRFIMAATRSASPPQTGRAAPVRPVARAAGMR